MAEFKIEGVPKRFQDKLSHDIDYLTKRGIRNVHVKQMLPIAKKDDYLYNKKMSEEGTNADLYKRFGFQVMADGIALQRCKFDNKA